MKMLSISDNKGSLTQEIPKTKKQRTDYVGALFFYDD